MIETPTRYIYNPELVQKSENQKANQTSFQKTIDDLLMFRNDNPNTPIEDLVLYTRGILKGRSNIRRKCRFE